MKLNMSEHILENMKVENLAENSNELFAALKSQATLTANNRVLTSWAEQTPTFDLNKYELLMSNMTRWLAPTATRLKVGLELIKRMGNLQFRNLESVFEHNIHDECGEGNPEKTHAKLFADSISTYAKVLYGTSELNKEEILQSTKELQAKSLLLFGEDLYVMLGACLAQEVHALPQLVHLRNGCMTWSTLFSPDEEKKIMAFYDIHLDGTEARHAEDLNQTIWQVIDTAKKQKLFFNGFNSFLRLLDNYWKGLEKRLL